MSISLPLKNMLAACLLTAGLAHATGIKPQTSVVIIDEADGEGTISVKNTDAMPVLLYSKLHNLPEDKEPLLVVTQPLAHVEGGDTQLIRFVLREHAPLKTERLKRVAFEGIPAADKTSGEVKIKMIIRQDLPVIIHPRGLALNDRPWQSLAWSIQGDNLVVRNDSPYVVRLAQKVQLLPQQTVLDLPRTYVLPGDVITLKAPASSASRDKPNASGSNSLASTATVRLFPASVYGYSVHSYDAPLVHPSTAH